MTVTRTMLCWHRASRASRRTFISIWSYETDFDDSFGCLAVSLVFAGAQTFSVLPEPDKANGAAVIICPGGSYYWLSRKIEGTEVAKKLADAGFTAFVLHYRHAGTRYFLFGNMAIPQNHYPNALDDLREAVMEVRRKASEYSVDRFQGWCDGLLRRNVLS